MAFNAERFAHSRAEAQRELLDGRPAEAVRHLAAAVASVLSHCSCEGQRQGPDEGRATKRRRVGDEGLEGLEGLVRQLGASPPAVVERAAPPTEQPQQQQQGFAHTEWRAAVEMLAVALACLSATAPELPTPPQAEALARYLDAYEASDAAESIAFRREYGGSAAMPDFAAAVVVVVRPPPPSRTELVASTARRC